MEFEKFPSLTRFSQGWTITEKIDGTNAQVAVVRTEHSGCLYIKEPLL